MSRTSSATASPHRPAALGPASSSPWERFGWAPFTAVLFGLTVLLALSARGAEPSGARP